MNTLLGSSKVATRLGALAQLSVSSACVSNGVVDAGRLEPLSRTADFRQPQSTSYAGPILYL
eukprot:6189943-Pleurochrysis_carterae.AAC.2